MGNEYACQQFECFPEFTNDGGGGGEWLDSISTVR